MFPKPTEISKTLASRNKKSCNRIISQHLPGKRVVILRSVYEGGHFGFFLKLKQNVEGKSVRRDYGLFRLVDDVGAKILHFSVQICKVHLKCS